MLGIVKTNFEMLAPIFLYSISNFKMCPIPPPDKWINRASPSQDATSPQIPPLQSLNVTTDTIGEESQSVRSPLDVDEAAERERLESPPPYHNYQFYEDVTEDLPPTYERALIMPYSMHYASTL